MKIRKERTNQYHRRRRSACLAGTSTRRWTCCILPSYPNNIYLSTVFVSTIMCMQNKKNGSYKVLSLSFFHDQYYNKLYILHLNTYANSIWNQSVFFIFHVLTFINDSMRLLEPILDESLVIIWITVKMLIGWFVYVPSFLHKLTSLYVNWKCTSLVLLWHFVSYLNN